MNDAERTTGGEEAQKAQVKRHMMRAQSDPGYSKKNKRKNQETNVWQRTVEAVLIAVQW